MRFLFTAPLLALAACSTGWLPEPRVGSETPTSVTMEYSHDEHADAAAAMAMARCRTHGRDAVLQTTGFRRPDGIRRAVFDCRRS